MSPKYPIDELPRRVDSQGAQIDANAAVIAEMQAEAIRADSNRELIQRIVVDDLARNGPIAHAIRNMLRDQCGPEKQW